MRKNSRLFLSFLSPFLAFLFAGFSTAIASSGQSSLDAAAQVAPGEILEHIDDLYRSNSSYSEIEMEITTPHWRRTLTMKIWTMGMEKTFIRITSPKKERGMATLRIGNEMWNYLPKINKVMKLSPSMMMNSWMGSDFTNDDLVNEFSYRDDYTYKFVNPEGASEDIHYIECIPREELPIVWGSIVLAIKKSDLIPVWEKYYDEKGKVMRVLTFSDVKMFGDRALPAVMEMIPTTREGHKTTIRYLSAEFNAGLNEDLFSLRNLRSR